MTQPEVLRDDEQDLLVVLPLSNRDMGTAPERDACEAFAETLEAELLQAGRGEYDGNEVGGGEYILFFCGPDADAMLALLRPLLQRSPFGHGAHFELMRDGPDGECVRQRLPI